MSNSIIEHINIIDALADQITALLDLIQCTGSDESIDIRSIKTAAEMNQTMFAELMSEVKEIENAWKETVLQKVEGAPDSND